MNLRKIAILSVAALSVLGSSLAEARGPYRHHGGRALLFAAPFIAAGAYLASRPYYRPAYRPAYYAPPYYYQPAPSYYYPPPPVYIERAPEYVPPPEPEYSVPPQSQYSPQPQPQYSEPQQPQYSEPRQSQPESQNWYFCAESQAYYPNVQSCAGGWQRQAPQQR
jgi:hypothetical protein